MKKRAGDEGRPASELIDERIAVLGDWRGQTLARLRALILEADPQIVEEWKWGGPVWSRHGIICTGETYKAHVKLTFAQGAATPDPTGLFNASLDGNVRRGLDVKQGEAPDADAFKALVRAAAWRIHSASCASSPGSVSERWTERVFGSGEPTGGSGVRSAPRKKASFTYLAKTWKLRNHPCPSTP